MAKAKREQIITETEAHFGYIKGTSKWAKVLEVGEYGNFEVNLYPDAEGFAEHVELFEKIRGDAEAEVLAAGKKISGLADVYKEDSEGLNFFQFKLPETDYEGKNNVVDIYDVGGNKVTEDWDSLIGNGSTLKVKYMAKPYYMASTKMVGISFRFYAVQVIKLEEYQGGGASGFGDETTDNEEF